jgi:hypothetical protein
MQHYVYEYDPITNKFALLEPAIAFDDYEPKSDLFWKHNPAVDNSVPAVSTHVNNKLPTGPYPQGCFECGTSLSSGGHRTTAEVWRRGVWRCASCFKTFDASLNKA